MAKQNIENVSSDGLKQISELCDKQIELFKKKKKPNKVNFYTETKKTVDSAREKLNKFIQKSKTTMVRIETTDESGAVVEKEVSIYEQFVRGKESTVTLAWLGEKLGDSSSSSQTIKTKEDFVDKLKNVGKGFLHGKGLAAGLMGAFAGVAIGEASTIGITSQLVKNGVMEESVGLFGLLKKGVKKLPELWKLIKTGAVAGWEFSPTAMVAGGAFLALASIPLIAKVINKAQENSKNANAFRDGVNKILKDDSTIELAGA